MLNLICSKDIISYQNLFFQWRLKNKVKRWTKAIKRGPAASPEPDETPPPDKLPLKGPRLGLKTLKKFETKKLRKNSKQLNISIVSMTEREQVRLQKIEDTKIKIVVSHVFDQGSILDHLILFITNIDRKNLRSLKRFQIFFLGQSLTFLLNRQAGLLQNLTVLSEDFITIMYTRTYSLRTNKKIMNYFHKSLEFQTCFQISVTRIFSGFLNVGVSCRKQVSLLDDKFLESCF